MEKQIPAYRGAGDYVFVCYAHEDADAVYGEIGWLTAQGVNVWYDEGISAGLEWSDALAHAIASCSRFIYFVTPNSVASENCRRELNFAQEEGREVVAVHLAHTEVPPGRFPRSRICARSERLSGGDTDGRLPQPPRYRRGH